MDVKIEPSIHYIGMAPNSYQDIESESEVEVVDDDPFRNAMAIKKAMKVVPMKMNIFVKKKKEKEYFGKKKDCCGHKKNHTETFDGSHGKNDLPKINKNNAFI